MSSLTHSRQPTTNASLPRKISQDYDYQKYIVIDSENQQEKNIKIQNINNKYIDSCCFSHNNKQSFIRKTSNISNSNYLSLQIPTQSKYIQLQISDTQNQIKTLQKECHLLETLINDMAAEQAKLIVCLRAKQRKQSCQKYEEKKKKQCPIHKHKNGRDSQIYQQKRQRVHKQENNQQKNTQISITTPLLSKNLNKPTSKHLDQVKTIDISSQQTKNISKQTKGTTQKKNKKIVDKRVGNTKNRHQSTNQKFQRIT